MKNILEDLFAGNINVMENLPVKERNAVSGEDAFINSLSSEQKQTYEEILASYMDRCALENQDCFMVGFKMAVNLILECLSGIEDKNI
jgi:hypothetical protein